MMDEALFTATHARSVSRRGWFLVLGATFAAQVWTLSRVDGYGLADSVEYMDRAWDVARGAGLGPESPRSFAFSGVLLPFFWVAELLGLHDLRGVVLAIRLGQMALGLLAVAAVTRIGGRLFEGPAGPATGLLLGLNPIFLQHSIEPLSGTAAALFMALALESLFASPSRAGRARDDWRRGLLGGTWLGLGALMAYQTLPLSALAVLAGLAADRGRRKALWGATLLSFVVWLLVQCLLDLAVFGSFGSTLVPYLAANVGGILARVLAELNLDRAAQWTYLRVAAASQVVDPDSVGPTLPALQSPDWYLVNLTSAALPPPGLLLVLCGVVAFAVRPQRAIFAILVVVVLNATLMSFKGAKSFRLWLPMLPHIALLGGAGFAWLHARRAVLARAGAWLGLAAASLGSISIVRGTNLAANGGYWRAMEALNELGSAATRPIRVASTYYWAVLFRNERGVELEKLPHHLDRWKHLDETDRAEVLAALAGTDAFVSHLSALDQDPRIAEVVGRELVLVDVFFDPVRARELGPIGLFARIRSDLPIEGRALFQTAELPPGGAEAYLERVQRPTRVVFARGPAEGRAPVSFVFLGWDLETGLCGGAGAWVTYHWLAEEVDGRDYLVRDRITDNLAREAWNHAPRAHGVLPTSRWTRGLVVRESYFVPVPREVRQFGGPYGRGELYPAELYLSIAEISSDGAEGARLPVLRGFDRTAIEPPRPEARSREPYRPLGTAGTRWNLDGQILAGAAWVPVEPPVEFPEDGGEP